MKWVFGKSQRLGRRSTLRSGLYSGMASAMIFVGPALAQESASPTQPKGPFARLFRSAEASQLPATSAKSSGANRPQELRVIDRETAQRMNQTRSAHLQAGSLRSQTLGSVDAQSDSTATTDYQPLQGIVDPEKNAVQQTSYQSGQPKYYQTPIPNPTPYDLAPGYGNPYGNPYGNFPPPYSNNVPSSRPLETGPLPPEHVLVDPQMELMDDRPGLPSEEHPSFNLNYFDNQHRSPRSDQPPPWEGYSLYRPQMSNTPLESDRLPQMDYRNPASTLNFDNGSRRGGDLNAYGQGYLQEGSNLHGTRLQSRPISATARALTLQEENRRHAETIQKLQTEIESHKRQWQVSQAAVKSKEDELNMALVRIEELRNQIRQLTDERNSAVNQRIALERQYNEQLKGIETMLDGVLLEQLSDKQ